ncbi:MAG: aminoacyl-tRNA hydrolase [Proteobacteria bacterium]|nr:aminoacyl-tRNA hydrolase [Pseudomonadota bacterium]MCP4916997.1 aminoacyl-tRNA hydrolase [Pseudomonadota bacterium]
MFVAGLGNPGRKYEGTRHNAGFLVVDRLAQRWGIDCSKKQFGALVGDGSIRHERSVLAKPQGFMNRSGHPLRSLLGFYKAEIDQLVVVHDDMDIPFGELKLKQGGGHGGHNGLRDIHKHFGGGDYLRVRFGVGRPPEGWNPADYVLGKWSSTERDGLDQAVDHAADAVEALLKDGLTAAMNIFHVRTKPSGPVLTSSSFESLNPALVAGGVI